MKRRRKHLEACADCSKDVREFLKALHDTPYSVLAHGGKSTDGRMVVKKLWGQAKDLRKADPEWCEHVAPYLVADAEAREKISLLIDTVRSPIEIIDSTYPAIGMGLITAGITIEAAAFLSSPSLSGGAGIALWVAVTVALLGYGLLIVGSTARRGRQSLRTDLLALSSAIRSIDRKHFGRRMR